VFTLFKIQQISRSFFHKSKKTIMNSATPKVAPPHSA
jgi:hypothetical protein